MKRVSPGTVTVGVLAILFGLVAVYAVRRAMDKPQAEQGVEVVVGVINLPRHGRLMARNLRMAQFPANEVPDGAIRSTATAFNRLMMNTVPAGVPLTESDLYPLDEEPLLSEQVPAGLRAVTISVAQNRALDGILLPESTIDVSLTAESTDPDYPGVVTRTLVRAVKVLATNQQRYRYAESSPASLRTITVAATPDDANKLILGQQFGNLSVTLRNDSDEFRLVGDYQQDVISVNDLLGLPIRRNTNRQFSSQIYRGTQMSEVTFTTEAIEEAEKATIAAENAAPLDPLGFRDRFRPASNNR